MRLQVWPLVRHDLDEIWVIARRRERLEELRRECPVPLCILAMDLTSEDAAGRLEQELKKREPEIAIMVNAAGFGKIGSFREITRQESSAMIRLNCQAVVEVTMVCIPYMKRKARILEICSTSGFYAGAGMYGSPPGCKVPSGRYHDGDMGTDTKDMMQERTPLRAACQPRVATLWARSRKYPSPPVCEAFAARVKAGPSP